MTDPAQPLEFRFEHGELKLSEVVTAIHKVLLDLPDLAALRAAASPGFWISAAREAVDMVLKLASVPVGKVLVGGWKQHARFAKYADPVQFPPEKVSRVPLAAHHIKSTYKPYIELLVDGAPSGTVPLEVVVDLAVEGVILVIQSGCFKRIEAGKVRLTGTLKCAETTICERATRDFSCSAGIPLGEDGIPIAAVV